MGLHLHHVAVICSNYERSRRFYTDCLGLKIVRESYRADRDSHKLDLAISDGTLVELFSFPNPPKRPSYPEACGLRHLAFRVADINAWKERLASFGIETEPIRTDEFTQRRYTFFADPDGLPLELYEVVPASD